jgi:multidrug efflux pump subunit AcrA (membrane-fusion protein)
MKKRWIYGIAILVVIVGVIIYSSKSEDSVVEITTTVKGGQFDVVVSTTGELQALNSTEVKGPADLREVRVHNVKIMDLVPEGTIVEAGDYVGSLDRTEVQDRLNNQADELEEDNANLSQAKLDTTISLLDYRNGIKDRRFAVEESQIIMEQSQYEPSATIRQAEMNLDKAERGLEQALANYELKKAEANNKIRRAERRLDEEYKERSKLLSILEQFDIYAPHPGMVIYKKEWGGAKRKVGSSINPWDPVVATLPDLTQMISKTYINEIDISKIETGQTVSLGVDAFPEREYTGLVIDVANVGEQLPNSDAKVFEVVIQLNESDTTLRPAMTTVNQVLTNSYDDVLFIPLEAIHSTDSMSYVYTVKQKRKQIIDLGEANSNSIIVTEGLAENDEIYLSIPEGSDNWDTEGWEIFEKVKARRIEEDIRMREEGDRMRQLQEDNKKKKAFDIQNLPKEQRARIEKMMKENGGQVKMMKGSSASGTSRSGSPTKVTIQR